MAAIVGVMRPAAVVLIACCACSSGCASALVSRSVTPARPAAEALLVLPGFGYGRDGERAFRELARSVEQDGLDLYLPTFIARSGLDESRRRLHRFIGDSRLERYQRVHVFAFLAGGWTFNSLGASTIPNLTTVVFDRSPYQERAPAVARETLKLFAWLRYGPVIFDVARTPYPPLEAPGVRVGLVVERDPRNSSPAMRLRQTGMVPTDSSATRWRNATTTACTSRSITRTSTPTLPRSGPTSDRSSGRAASHPPPIGRRRSAAALSPQVSAGAAGRDDSVGRCAA